MSFKDVFGVNSKEKLGSFPVEIPILTEGKPVYVKQHPIPQQYQNDVINEIEKMLKLDVIETCLNPRGWNSPILAVKKADNSIRICCNFQRTINDRLREDSDKFELPVTQILFHEMGRDNKFFAS